MTLIADGGSTKCDWVLLDKEGVVLFKTKTDGLNPNVVSSVELNHRIQDNPQLQNVFEEVATLDFYGAGCGSQTPRKKLFDILKQLFPNAQITIEEDLLAAALAVTQQPGIVCILGTGSNSCYFDGKKTHNAITSLGYILMDEASGNYFGKRLIRDFFYKKMPVTLAAEFEKLYDLNPDVIKINIYQKPNPNAYLASFSEFIFTTKDANSYFQDLLKDGISQFIENRVLCYSEAKKLPVHFIGSIAHFSKDIIKDCLEHYHLQPGNIIQRPIDGLTAYYQNIKSAQ